MFKGRHFPKKCKQNKYNTLQKTRMSICIKLKIILGKEVFEYLKKNHQKNSLGQSKNWVFISPKI